MHRQSKYRSTFVGWRTVALLFAIWGCQCQVANAAEQSAWIELKGEKSALSLDQTIFAGKLTDNSAFRHETDGRSDWIQSGTMAISEPNITMMMTRYEAARTVRYSVVKDLDELAELKAIQKRFNPVYYELATRFGTLRSVLFNVNADGVLKHCVGFHKPGTAKLYIKGFVCSADLQQVSPERVACLVDKVRFVRLEDESLVKLMLGIEQAPECGAKRLEPKNTTVKPNVEGAKESL